jgi:hypothetical protein
VPELAKPDGIHPNQIYGWKKQVLDNLASLFARGASALGDGEEEHKRETAKLSGETKPPEKSGALRSWFRIVVYTDCYNCANNLCE